MVGGVELERQRENAHNATAERRTWEYIFSIERRLCCVDDDDGREKEHKKVSHMAQV